MILADRVGKFVAPIVSAICKRAKAVNSSSRAKAEGSRCESFKVTPRDPSTSLRMTGRRTVGIEAALWYTNHMLRFAKMNGAGNDFVMIDNRAGNVQLSAEQIAKICDRHRGVGADGVLLVERATNSADFRMRYYNSDGGEAEMCGNGARCFARFVEKVADAGKKFRLRRPPESLPHNFMASL